MKNINILFIFWLHKTLMHGWYSVWSKVVVKPNDTDLKKISDDINKALQCYLIMRVHAKILNVMKWFTLLYTQRLYQNQITSYVIINHRRVYAYNYQSSNEKLLQTHLSCITYRIRIFDNCYKITMTYLTLLANRFQILSNDSYSLVRIFLWFSLDSMRDHHS